MRTIITPRIQEAQVFIGHVIAEYVEQEFGDNKVNGYEFPDIEDI